MEVPNVVVAAIGLALLTMACVIFSIPPLHPLLTKVLPSIGAGALASITRWPGSHVWTLLQKTTLP